jgi:hypothetical protein
LRRHLRRLKANRLDLKVTSPERFPERLVDRQAPNLLVALRLERQKLLPRLPRLRLGESSRAAQLLVSSSLVPPLRPVANPALRRWALRALLQKVQNRRPVLVLPVVASPPGADRWLQKTAWDRLALLRSRPYQLKPNQRLEEICLLAPSVQWSTMVLKLRLPSPALVPPGLIVAIRSMAILAKSPSVRYPTSIGKGKSKR